MHKGSRVLQEQRALQARKARRDQSARLVQLAKQAQAAQLEPKAIQEQLEQSVPPDLKGLPEIQALLAKLAQPEQLEQLAHRDL